MKRLVSITVVSIIVVLLFMVQGCSGISVNAPDSDLTTKFDPEEVASRLIVEDYSFKDAFSENYVCLAITNPTEFDIALAITLRAYDASGNLLTVKNSTPEYVSEGQTVLEYFVLYEDYASKDYSFSVSEARLEYCIANELESSSVSRNNKEIISVTNNGKYTARSVEVTTLFLKNDVPVYLDWAIFGDVNQEIQPGDTATEEMYCSRDYDEVKIFLQDSCWLGLAH